MSKPRLIYRELQGYKYELMKELRFPIYKLIPNTANSYIEIKNGVLIIKKGYAWDGASGPTWDDKTNMRGSLVHDAMYQLIREDLIPRKLRRYFDELLHDICIEDGGSKFRYHLWFKMVRLFGVRSSKRERYPRGKIVEIK